MYVKSFSGKNVLFDSGLKEVTDMGLLPDRCHELLVQSADVSTTFSQLFDEVLKTSNGGGSVARTWRTPITVRIGTISTLCDSIILITIVKHL